MARVCPPHGFRPSETDIEIIRHEYPNVNIREELQTFCLTDFAGAPPNWSTKFVWWCRNANEKYIRGEKGPVDMPSREYVPEWQRRGFENQEAMDLYDKTRWAHENRTWVEENGTDSEKALVRRLLG